MQLRTRPALATPLCAAFVAAAAIVAVAADVQPVSVRVRQTPGGPRIFVDGKPIPPRAFYGAGPSIAFIAEMREYVFTLPFTAPISTERAEVRIGFPPDPSQFWIHDVELVDGETGAKTPVPLALSGAAADGTPHPPTISCPCPIPLVEGRKYRLRIPIRSDHGRSFFDPGVVAFDTGGKARRCPLAYGDTLAETTRIAGEAGVNIVTFGAPNGWVEPERAPDWRALDADCRRLVAANPNVLLLPRIGMNAPPWFLKRHPEAKMRFDDGFVMESSSVSHRPYRAAACEHLERLVRHLRETFPRNFAGVHVNGQNSGEWFYQKAFDRELGGYEAPVRDAFRIWLAREGEPDASTAEVPPPDERRDTSDGCLLDPVRQRRLVLFNRFRQEEMASFLSEMGAAIRRGSDGQSLAVFFYGYSWELGNNMQNGAAASGHYALEWLLVHGRDNIDALAAPYSYANRKWPGSISVMSAAETLARAGILWFNEDDTRTYREDVWDFRTLAGGSPKTKEQTLDILRRNVSFEILRGVGDWWMDLFGRGWYNDPDLWKLRGELEPLEKAMFSRAKPYEPEIANVVDERSFLYLGCGSPGSMNVLLNRYLFDGCGAPYGQYLLNDVLAHPIGARLYCMSMAIYLDADQRAKLAALRASRPDATFLWCWAPGYLSEKGMSLDTIAETTGFRVERVSPATPLARSTELGLAKGLSHKEWGGGLKAGAAPLFAPVLENGDEVWATYRDLPGKPALVARKRVNGTGYDIFLGPGQFFRELLHLAAKTAGVHCYLDCAAGNVIASEGYLAVQNVTDKPLEVTLRDGTRHTLDIPKGATRILRDN